MDVENIIVCDCRYDRFYSPGTPARSRARIMQRVLVLSLCSLLIFAVLAFGAVDEWSTFVFEAGAAVLFLVWVGKQVVSRQVKLSKNPLHLPALLFFRAHPGAGCATQVRLRIRY